MAPALAAVLACALGGWGCGPSESAAPRDGSPQGPFYRDVAAEVGLDFVHFNGMSGELYFCETVGPGGALFDYDNDGDLDVYLVQGNMLGEGKTIADAVFPPRHPLPLQDRLYRNDLEVRADGGRTLHFTDVTAESRIDALGYGMGVATGDYDNDGWVDLYVANFGSNQMWHNNGDGTFTDATATSGTDEPRWSSSAMFFDYDRDGLLDLYVTNYVDFSLATHRPCFAPSSRRDYCGPKSYKPEPSRLFHNLGHGRFEDTTGTSGIVSEYGPGLGVVAGDFDDDGWLDAFVANDGAPNFLWMNQRDGTFRNQALLAGAAVNANGEAEAGMGIDAADVDRDGDEDVFITHLDGETATLYINRGDGHFDDRSASSRLGPATRPYTGFGTAFTDFDNDGWPDIVVVNGAVKTVEALAKAGDPYPLHQRKRLYRNLGDGTFADVSDIAGEAFALSEVGRGAAVGDVDQDGDADVLVTNNAGPVRLLLNERGQDRHWVGLRIYNEELRRDMLGSHVAVVLPDGTELWQRVRTGASYLTSNDPRILMGLGRTSKLDRVRVEWPDGTIEEWDGVPVDRYTTLVQGTGTAVTGRNPGS